MTNFNEKMTYANAINYAIRFMQGEDMTEDQKFLTAEKLVTLGEQLQKRNSSKSSKPTKKQVENGNVKAQILGVLTTEGKRCSEIANAVGISSQKCSALLTQLVNTEQVEKYDEKRVTYFRIPQ